MTTYPQPLSVFIVWNINNTAASFQVPIANNVSGSQSATNIYWNANSISVIGVFGYTKNIPFNTILTSLEDNGSLSKLYENGVLENNINTSSIGLSGLFVGGYTGGFLKGSIKEIIIYNKLVTDTERVYVENYLNNKYNLY